MEGGVVPDEIQRIRQQIVFGIGFESRSGGQLDAVSIVFDGIIAND